METPGPGSSGTADRSAEPQVHGSCAPRFEKVRRAFEASFATGELGAAVALTADRTPVVDLWGGFADAARTRPWRRCADPDAKPGFGYVTNRMQSGLAGDARGFALIAAVTASL